MTSKACQVTPKRVAPYLDIRQRLQRSSTLSLASLPLAPASACSLLVYILVGDVSAFQRWRHAGACLIWCICLCPVGLPLGPASACSLLLLICATVQATLSWRSAGASRHAGTSLSRRFCPWGGFQQGLIADAARGCSQSVF